MGLVTQNLRRHDIEFFQAVNYAAAKRFASQSIQRLTRSHPDVT
jgi:hypothetical protein